VPPSASKEMLSVNLQVLTAYKISETPQNPLAILMISFWGYQKLLVAETNRNYQYFLDTNDIGPSPLPHVTESERFIFSANYHINGTEREKGNNSTHPPVAT
jgi:hypothetical protein